jgi:hypothetical protein
MHRARKRSRLIHLTTTSTTTITLLPCLGAHPVCIGSCPAGSTCTADRFLGACVCVPD